MSGANNIPTDAESCQPSSNLHLDGEEYFAQSREQLWDALIDMTFLSQCLPDVESVDQVEAERLECRIRPSFSFLRGRLDVSLEIVDQQAPKSARWLIRGKGIGSSVEIVTCVELAESADEESLQVSEIGRAQRTCLRWTAEVQQLGGLLKPVSRGLIGAAARKVICSGWDGFRRKLETDQR